MSRYHPIVYYLPNFILNKKCWCFWLRFPKKGISSPKRKDEHHHQFQHIRFNISTKIYHSSSNTTREWSRYCRKLQKTKALYHKVSNYCLQVLYFFHITLNLIKSAKLSLHHQQPWTVLKTWMLFGESWQT